MATLGLPVADPGFFSGGGSNVQSGCANLYLPVMFMFSRVSVCLGEVSTPLHTGIHRPRDQRQTPPRQTCPGQNGQTHPLGKHPPGQTLPWADIPPGQTSPAQCMLGYTPPLCSACWDTVNKRAVCIPLECILVLQCFCLKLHENERIWTKGRVHSPLSAKIVNFILS